MKPLQKKPSDGKSWQIWKPKPKGLIGILLFFLLLNPLWTESLGPLTGKNLYLPHLPYLSFPGTLPEFQDGQIRLETNLYWINEFFIWGIPPGGEEKLAEIPNADDYLAMDYESLVWEQSISKDWGRQGRLQVILRQYAYFDGIGDPIIEGFHNLFFLPNAGREYFPNNRLFVNLEGTSGHDLYLNENTIAFGDIDLFYHRPLPSLGRWNQAWGVGLKLPTGSPRRLSGSGSPDIGGQYLISRTGDRSSLHLQGGLLIPLSRMGKESTQTRPYFQLATALEYRIQSHWAIIGQIHCNSSPLKSDVTRKSLMGIPLWAYQSLQTNLRLGLKWKLPKGLFQFYFEEDPLTYEGADIILNCSYSFFWE